MNVLRNKQIRLKNLWEPECFGLFNKQDDKVTFFFSYQSNLLAISEEDAGPKLIYSCGCNESLPFPNKWKVVGVSNAAFLLVSEDRGVDLKKNEFSYDIPAEIQKIYSQYIRPEKYYVEAPQHLEEFTICHKGDCGYICWKEDSKLWEFTGRGYLYTDMVRWKDRVLFGTGGNGGYFYVLDIHNGLPLVSIKTGGTQCFVHVNNLCYILTNEKRAKLLCIDLSDGRIISQCDLPGVATIESRIAMIDNHIHVITFDLPRYKSDSFNWSCVKI